MNNKNNDSLNKKILEDKLKEIGTNIHEVKAWLNSKENSDFQDDTQTYFSFFKTSPIGKSDPGISKFFSYLADEEDEKFDVNPFSKSACYNKEQLKNQSINEEKIKNVIQKQEHRITFRPGNDSVETAVYVGANKLSGVVRAILDYDAEMGVPTLQLHIVNPKIISFHSEVDENF